MPLPPARVAVTWDLLRCLRNMGKQPQETPSSPMQPRHGMPSLGKRSYRAVFEEALCDWPNMTPLREASKKDCIVCSAGEFKIVCRSNRVVLV